MFVSELHIVFKHSVKQKVNVGNMKKTVSTDGNKYLKKQSFFYPYYKKILYIAYVAAGLIVAYI